MANKLPPLPVGVAPGSGYWNDWYEKLRTLINSFAAGFPFSSITSLPTTLSGYGITDAQKSIQFKEEGSNLGTTGTTESLNFVVRTPPSAWSRVFEGPIGADGNPSNRGGLTSAEVSLMRETSRAQQPTDERRRMPAPSEAARARALPINANTLGTRTVSAGARAEHLGLPKATPSGGTSC